VAAIGEAIRRMEASGFRIEVRDGALRVAPAERLNEAQRQWLVRNKPALVRHIKALALPHVREMVELFDAEVMDFDELHPP
jgi:mRNA-degrading endonuclease toxin of MazEF toxin-antitoxin module